MNLAATELIVHGIIASPDPAIHDKSSRVVRDGVGSCVGCTSSSRLLIENNSDFTIATLISHRLKEITDSFGGDWDSATIAPVVFRPLSLRRFLVFDQDTRQSTNVWLTMVSALEPKLD